MGGEDHHDHVPGGYEDVPLDDMEYDDVDLIYTRRAARKKKKPRDDAGPARGAAGAARAAGAAARPARGEPNADAGPRRYNCPCGDVFEISLEELHEGETIAHCNGCTLKVRVRFEPKDLPALPDDW